MKVLRIDVAHPSHINIVMIARSSDLTLTRRRTKHKREVFLSRPEM